MASSTPTTTPISLSSSDFLSLQNPKPSSSIALRRHSNNQSLSTKTTTVSLRKATPLWRTRATIAGAAEAPATQLESASEEVVAAAGSDGGSTVISVLLIVAFVGLSLLTIGVVYIGVTDFLQKREREKFDKEEEAAVKKKKGKKKKAKARTGPRGFGQKQIDDDIDDID